MLYLKLSEHIFVKLKYIQNTAMFMGNINLKYLLVLVFQII